MNAEEPLPDEESLLTRLVACDEALAAGAKPHEPPDTNSPGEMRPRLEGDLACIQVLRKVLPRRSSGLTPVTPLLEPSTLGADDVPFRELSRFRIRRRLGHGAFGMVFLALDPQLGREVALKVPRPEVLLTGELRERFFLEARAAAGLDHPNLVPIYEAGAVGPLCYIASAYCPGITLSEWLKDRSELPQERLAAALVAKLADAVGHAHSRGVVHRDLKPSNVLLQAKRRDPADSNSTLKEPASVQTSLEAELDFVPRITDFGLAKLIGDGTELRGDAVGFETRTGAVLGTPNYMAPEQARGKNKEVGPAADVYALGGILYELLTGRPPFRGESLLDTLEQVRTCEPLSPARLRPKLSRDLETICLKCLQKEPRQRYENASALAEDLRHYLAGEPIHARPIRAWERGIKWARRRPALAALLVLSIVAPLVIAGISLAYNGKLATSNEQLENALEAEKNQRQRAETREWDARNLGYVSDMNLVQQDWAAARMERLQELVLRQIPPPDTKDLRGFEWYYWQRLLNYSAVRTLNGHAQEVLCVACSPDGKLLASGGKDRTVRLWDTATGRPTHVLASRKSGANVVRALAFADEGRLVAATWDRTVSLLDVTGRRRPQILNSRGRPVIAVAVANRHRILSFSRTDGTVELWDWEKNIRLHSLKQHQQPVKALAFSSNERLLASADDAGSIYLWKTPRFELRATYTIPFRAVNGLAFAPDGKSLAVACSDGTIRLWNLEENKESTVLTGHDRDVLCVQFAPDGKRMISAGADATIRLWDASGSPLYALKGHIREVRSALFAPNGRTVVSASSDGKIKLWDARRNPEQTTWYSHDPGVLHLAFSRDGKVLATGGDDTLQLRDCATGRHLASFPPYSRDLSYAVAALGGFASRLRVACPRTPTPILGVAFAQDDNQLAVVCLDPFVHIWDRRRGKEITRLVGHTHQVSALARSEDGTLLASGGMDGSIHLWDWHKQEMSVVCTGHTESIRALAFSPDGKLLASGSSDRTIRIWEPKKGQLQRIMAEHRGIVRGLSFSPDGRTLASCGEEGKVCLWAVATGDVTKRLEGHLGAVYTLAFSPDGRTLASGGGDVKLWQATTGRELTTFPVVGYVYALAWSPDSRQLACGGSEGGQRGFVTLWNAKSGG